MQLSLSLSMVGMLVAATLVYALTLWLLSDGGSASEGWSSSHAMTVGMAVNGLFFVVALLSSIVVSIFVTHRIAGPAMVIETAVRGFIEGDFEKRLTLREKDHLKSLAAAVRELRAKMLGERKAQRVVIVQMESALRAGDADLALKLCRNLIGEQEPKPAPAQETLKLEPSTEPTLEQKYSSAG
jgi:HAMP domain-containing protein